MLASCEGRGMVSAVVKEGRFWIRRTMFSSRIPNEAAMPTEKSDAHTQSYEKQQAKAYGQWIGVCIAYLP
jgi:hypothetical protein